MDAFARALHRKEKMIMTHNEIREVLNDIRAYCSTTANMYDDDPPCKENEEYKRKMTRIANACSEAMDLIEERKQGEWEYGYTYPDGKYVKCSECQEIIKCIYPMKYCPNCGAEMRGNENE